MANVDEIKKKIKEDGFEYLAEVPCYYWYSYSFHQELGDYYLCAKAIGNTLFYKIVDKKLNDYLVEIIPANVGGYNAQFKKDNKTCYFKLPNL
jgi:hypothetical protein